MHANLYWEYVGTVWMGKTQSEVVLWHANMWRLCCIQWDLKPNSWIKYILEWYLHGECWPIPVNKKTAKSHSRSIQETWNVDLRFTTSGSLFETGCMFQDCTYRQWNPMTALNIFFPDPFFAPVNLWQSVLYVFITARFVWNRAPAVDRQVKFELGQVAQAIEEV